MEIVSLCNILPARVSLFVLYRAGNASSFFIQGRALAGSPVMNIYQPLTFFPSYGCPLSQKAKGIWCRWKAIFSSRDRSERSEASK